MRSVPILVIALAFIAGVSATDRSFSAGGMSVSVSGQSGQIKIYPAIDSNNFIQIKQSKLEEVTSAGSGVSGRSVNLASTDAGWSVPTTYTQSNGIVYLETKFTSNFPLGGSQVQFVLLARLYQNTTTVNSAGATVTVSQNSLKFDINVTGWPAFGAATNTLNYDIEVASKGGNSGGKLEKHSGSSKESVIVQNGVMEMPTTALVDGQSKSIGITLNSQGNKDTVTFAFPAFTSTLVYDPVLCIGCSDAASTAASMLVVLLSIVIAYASQQQ